jgi:hypothetical protein
MNLIAVQLVKKFLSFSGNSKFIPVFRGALYWSSILKLTNTVFTLLTYNL